MKSLCFEIKYQGNEKFEDWDIQDMLGDLTDSEMWETEKKSKGRFFIHYLGMDYVKVKDIKTELSKAELDREGIFTVKKVKPKYEICEYCGGTGNEETMDNIDCGNCGGNGWVK